MKKSENVDERVENLYKIVSNLDSNEHTNDFGFFVEQEDIIKKSEKNYKHIFKKRQLLIVWILVIFVALTFSCSNF